MGRPGVGTRDPTNCLVRTQNLRLHWQASTYEALMAVHAHRMAMKPYIQRELDASKAAAAVVTLSSSRERWRQTTTTTRAPTPCPHLLSRLRLVRNPPACLSTKHLFSNLRTRFVFKRKKRRQFFFDCSNFQSTIRSITVIRTIVSLE